MTTFGDMHHVGINVKDLEQSLQWYEHMFGITREFVATGSGPELAAAVGVPNARLSFAFLRFGSCVVELLSYDNERSETFDRTNADVGTAHVCIDVPDITSAYAELQAKGAEFLSPPLHIDEGPLKGCSFAYLRDPDGLIVEIFQHAPSTAP